MCIRDRNILHLSFHKFEKLKSTDGIPSGAIFGFFRSLHGFLHRWDPDEVIIKMCIRDSFLGQIPVFPKLAYDVYISFHANTSAPILGYT